MRAVVEIWLKSLIDEFTLGGLHSAMVESQAFTMAMEPILKRAVSTKTGNTDVAMQILPTIEESGTYSLRKVSTPTLPMTRMDESPEKRATHVNFPEEKVMVATRASWRTASYRISKPVAWKTSLLVSGP